MSVLRRLNLVGQKRVDLPDLRELESAASNDFDDLIKSVITGTSQGYIMRGFEISMAGAIGGAASGLQLIVDPGAVLHVTSSQSGTFYLVPPGTTPKQLNSATNTIVDGAFAPSAINYIGLEYERFIDDSTSAQANLWNPTTNNESTKNIPRAQILRYRIKISTSSPASNVLPIATVTTDAGNNVVDITDCRPLLFRLGQGGFSPNPTYTYPWTAHSEGRSENPSTSSSNSVNPFRGGDKMLGNLKDILNALMTEFQQIKGTPYWYSLNTSGSLASIRQDLGNTVVTGRGFIGHSDTVAGLLNWNEDIQIRVVGSRLSYKLLANPSSSDVTLAENKVAYINLVRGVEIVPNLIFTNGSAVVTSVGAIAWTSNLQSGDWVKKGQDTDAGYYQIQSVDSLTQITLTENYGGTSTGAPGTKAKYAFGVYQNNPTPSTDRHIKIVDRHAMPAGENIFWLFLRSDNGGTIPRVYIRFMGSELQQGEDREISDDIPLELLRYIGSSLESASAPQYVSALNPGSLPEITDLKFGAASTILNNQYFFINSSGDWREYYVWFNKDGAGVDPAPAGKDSKIQVAITTGMTASQVAAAVASAMNATTEKDFTAVQRAVPNDDTVRVTNNSAGTCVNAINFNVGAPFAVTLIQNGTGLGNRSIQDGDNLTLAIKKLDDAVGDIATLLDNPGYDESVLIVTSGAIPPDSLNGPIAANTQITLPNNSRLSNLPQKYTVGKGVLQLCLNGQRLTLGVDWNEVGALNSASDKIEILQNLVVGDDLKFELIALGGPGGGSGGIGPQGPPGPAGPAGADAIGGPVAISTKNANYTVLNSDNVLLANCALNSVTFALPAAASAVGQVFFFKKIDSSVNPMIIDANSGELIDGQLTQQTTVQWESFTLVSDGVAWYVI